MTRKFFAQAIVLLLVIGVLFGSCVLEFDFDRRGPWMNAAGGTVSQSNLSSSAQGFGGPVTVTLDLVNGFIENVRIDARHETASYADRVVPLTERNAVLLNRFDFLPIAGATRTSNAVLQAAEAALAGAMVVLD